jgi:hypothetical protein
MLLAKGHLQNATCKMPLAKCHLQNDTWQNATQLINKLNVMAFNTTTLNKMALSILAFGIYDTA